VNDRTEEEEMKTVRELMTEGAECVRTSDTLVTAAQRMRDLDVGAMPICGDDDRLAGVITDRDIVVKCIADGGDPKSTEVGEFAEGKPVTVGADDDIEEALRTMTKYDVRRLPVIDGHRLVGMLSQADIAQSDPDAAGRMVSDLSSSPENN
jgi:CBS domain-containing protein